MRDFSSTYRTNQRVRISGTAVGSRVGCRQVFPLVGTTSVNPVVPELTDSDACGASTRKSLEVEPLSTAPLLPWASRDFADSLRPPNEIRDRRPDLVGAVLL